MEDSAFQQISSLNSNDVHEPLTEVIPFREAIGCLMFAAILSRPDSIFTVSYVIRFVSTPEVINSNAVKRIFKYLSHTLNYEIRCYEKHRYAENR